MFIPNTTHVNPAGLRPILVKRGLSPMLGYYLSMVISCMKLSIFALAPFFFSSAFGQTIDQGRGPVQLTVPQNYSGKNPTPLIVLLHGFRSNGSKQDSYLGFSDIANDNGFLFIAPTGSVNPEGKTFWNATPACCDFFGSNVDDVGYIKELIDAIKLEYNVDSNRVYLVGHSNGGFMSYQVAYNHPSIIAAVVSLAGASHDEVRPAPAGKVHTLQIHGTRDLSIRFSGGFTFGSAYPGAVETVTTWAGYNGCSLVAEEGQTLDLVANLTGNETTSEIYDDGCKSGGSAELWTIEAGGHIPLLSNSFAQQVVDWLFVHTKSDWPADYNGVTPSAMLGLSYNNIGNFSSADNSIYTCVRTVENGIPTAIGGIEQFDIAMKIISYELGVIQITNSRLFNADDVRNENNELPDCSGIFELSTNLYTDIIQVGNQVFEVVFELRDSVNLEFDLVNFLELN